MILHHLHTSIRPPERMNNPFDYEPHPLCLIAAEEVMSWLNFPSNNPSCLKDTPDEKEDSSLFILHSSLKREGKMFGVLVVETGQTDADGNAQLGYLAAYSGQIGGRSDWDGFVPAVFDYLQPGGYFKTHEKEIERMGERIAQARIDKHYLNTLQELHDTKEQADKAAEEARQRILEGKQRRMLRRQQAVLSADEEERLIRESQYEKAEWRRTKKRHEARIRELQERVDCYKDDIRLMEQQRKRASQQLQHWLFAHFEMLNANGERRNLNDIFADTAFHTPPSGAGECCEPKLLQYAYANGLRPRCMAMFWVGPSPKMEVRHHAQFYPACNGKCKPILSWMCPTVVCSSPKSEVGSNSLSVVYEDDHLIVVNKPAGMLSVPGKEKRQSVFSLMRERYPELTELMPAHRLDEATSGLMVIAKSREVYAALQRQFAEHSVKKRYVAILDGMLAPDVPKQGTITLPLRPDPLDRPRQVVDKVEGKEAVTTYEVIGEQDGRTRIALFPHTGRTHQLRIHCAHADGLNCPIVGDTLYGRRSDRLYLHAEQIAFTHPVTGDRLVIEAPAQL